MKNKALFVIAVLAFLVLLSHLTKGCGGNTRKETRLAWPLEYMLEKHGVGVFDGEADKSIFISAAKDVQLPKLVDLEFFGAFQPGLKIEEAKMQFGDPLRTYTKRNREIRALYKVSNGRIEVADQPFGSEGETAHRRSIYIYLKPKTEGCRTTSDVFDPSISKLIPDKTRIEICVADEEQRVWALVDNKCVIAINWIGRASYMH